VRKRGSWRVERLLQELPVKVVITLGSDAPKPSIVVPLLKLGLIGLAAFLVISRKDIRTYMRMRNT